jgi:hypothetical protein
LDVPGSMLSFSPSIFLVFLASQELPLPSTFSELAGLFLTQTRDNLPPKYVSELFAYF